MTTQPKELTPLEKHIEKVLKEAEKNGVVVQQVGYKDRIRIHVTATRPGKK